MTGVGHMTRKVLRECLMSREETHKHTHTDRYCVSTYSMYKLLHTDMAELEPQ